MSDSPSPKTDQQAGEQHNEPLTLLLVDDEKPARQRLAQLLAPHSRYRVIGEAEDGINALQLVDERQPDVLLLDIRMPGMDGIEVARHLLDLDHPPAVIYTTAYDEFALEAFETRALHYLVKPIREQRLLDALSRAAITRANPEPKQPEIIRERRSHFSVYRQGKRFLVAVEQLLYLQAEQKYVSLHTADDEWLIDESLTQLEDEFGELVVRVHRNALVWRSAIQGITRTDAGYSLFFEQSDKQLPISRRRISAVKKLLK